MKKHQNTLSLEDLTSHQQRIRSIVRKINQYSPTFHINSNYNHSRIIEKIKQRREEQDDRLFEENLNMIDKLQNIQPRINTKNFPTVNLALWSKRKGGSLSERKFKQTRDKKSPKQKTEDEILGQNIQMIEKLEIIDKKITCWQDKSLMKSKVILERKQKQKRNEILQKFKEISKEMRNLRTINQKSRFKTCSPYITDRKARKQSQASYQTNANSFLTRAPYK